jgi:hypothetical protein
LIAGKKGRGRSRKTLEQIEACHEILAEIQPAAVRAVCYRLFALGLIASMKKVETNKVSRLLTQAREDGEIPWEWIVDETREVERISRENPERFMECTQRSYRRDRWENQRFHVELWSEKGTVRGTLAPVLNSYGVPFRVMHGYASATAVNQAADDSAEIDKPFVALYVGDWDPSGLHMSEVDLPERVARYLGEISFHRIALTQEDVENEKLNLPSFDADTKQGDARYQWFVRHHGQRCVELDALSPPILRSRVEEAIKTWIDSDTWNRAARVEAAEIKSMNEFFSKWRPVEGVEHEVSR